MLWHINNIRHACPISINWHSDSSRQIHQPFTGVKLGVTVEILVADQLSTDQKYVYFRVYNYYNYRDEHFKLSSNNIHFLHLICVHVPHWVATMSSQTHLTVPTYGRDRMELIPNLWTQTQNLNWDVHIFPVLFSPQY